ncbi:MAG TPA: DUF1854 domain-containing protein [Fimbriimonadaceae bacterium]|nr:DUF1854 domain-containing protein [Fimbriimonadaceae bacterium]
MNPQTLCLFHAPEDRFRLTVGEEKSYVTVKPVWSAPLSHPGRYLSLVDGKGEEIVMLADPKELPAESHRSLELELKRRYLTSTILSIDHAKVEFGATYWTVRTDRGSRDFVTQSLQENAQWLGENHLLLVDVDGNRFEIPDVTALDETSRHFVETIL